MTGEADSSRVLYENDADFVRKIKIKILANGINAPSERGDFQDRCVATELERIPKGERKPEAHLWREFEEGHAKLLGAIFGALSGGMRYRKPLAEYPRLAD